MKILVTRPQPQAGEWVTQLGALGEDAAALPLIGIAPPEDRKPVADAWRSLAGVRLVMFVSPNAATWFARLKPQSVGWPAGTLAAAPGPGTARTVHELLGPEGLPDTSLLTPPDDSAQFDSEHLWPVLESLPWQGTRVLIASGGDQGEARGRLWLTQRLQAAGAQVHAVLTYQRGVPVWSNRDHALMADAAAHPGRHLWLLSSSEAVRHLHTLAGGVPAGSLALATHPRVADTARQAGFAQVHETRPTPEAVAQARRSWTAGGG